jgi:hypothetical protein
VPGQWLRVFLLPALICSLAGAAARKGKDPAQVPAESGAAQTSIRVESRLVVVRALVVDKEHWDRHRETEAERRSSLSNWEAFGKLRPTEPWQPKISLELNIPGLTAGDFHVFVEGTEQKTVGVTTEGMGLPVRDNRGMHDEFGETPTGKWSTTDLSKPWINTSAPFYNIAFVPTNSEPTGCHEMKIRVDRRNAVVFARREYCASETPYDTLSGTEFGTQMEHILGSGEHGEIPFSLQTGFLYAGMDKARVQISFEFPWDSLHRQWEKDWQLHATIGALGLVYKRDGGLAARFSALACCSSETLVSLGGTRGMDFDEVNNLGHELGLPVNPLQSRLDHYAEQHLPARYETQISLPTGEYELKVILSDGGKFGRAEVPLFIDRYDGKQLAISSVMLCKRYRDAHVAAVERAAANFAPQYVPLVSKGIEFTPTGDTRFKKGEPLIPYFEVYEPLLAAGSGQSPGMPASAGMTSERAGATMPAGMTTEGAAGATPEGMTIPGNGGGNPSTTPKVEAHIRILDAKTGKVVKDFPPVDATPYMNPGSTTIPIAREISFEQLPKGAYRLEVQATDSAGRTTAVRTADFTVE